MHHFHAFCGFMSFSPCVSNVIISYPSAGNLFHYLIHTSRKQQQIFQHMMAAGVTRTAILPSEKGE